jgi:hypothetical protein
MRGNCTPVVVECADYLLVAARADGGPGQNHQILATEHRLMQTETFTDQALYPVSLYGTSGGLDGNGRSQTRVIQTVGDRQDRYQCIAGLVLTTPEDPLILGRREQAVSAWITRRHNQPARCRSDRQAGASLGPASVDDKAAVLGAHPGTKTVGALALQVAGLKGSLHGAIGSQIGEGPLLGRAKSGRAEYWFYPGVVNRRAAPARAL